jgi:hypothetical protein
MRTAVAIAARIELGSTQSLAPFGMRPWYLRASAAKRARTAAALRELVDRERVRDFRRTRLRARGRLSEGGGGA